jgi:hypothetical protein
VCLLRTKLKEFLDLEHGNHSVFDYTRQFNTLAQYGSYHVNTDEKKANLYHEGLTVHLQERLGLSPNLSYNELASAAIDQERLMKAVAKADEKKKKKMMPGHANYTTVEEIPMGEQVLAGTFFLNEHPVIILFDSRASYDFMSSTCAKKAKLSLVASGAPYVNSTPEG